MLSCKYMGFSQSKFQKESVCLNYFSQHVNMLLKKELLARSWPACSCLIRCWDFPTSTLQIGIYTFPLLFQAVRPRTQTTNGLAKVSFMSWSWIPTGKSLPADWSNGTFRTMTMLQQTEHCWKVRRTLSISNPSCNRESEHNNQFFF